MVECPTCLSFSSSAVRGTGTFLDDLAAFVLL